MDVKTFQKKLEKIVAFGKAQGNEISLEQIRNLMGEDQLEDAQIGKIAAYLKTLNILCKDAEENGERVPEAEPVPEADPLSVEEKQYLKEYQETLKEVTPAKEGEVLGLYRDMEAGNRQAAARLAELFLPQVIRICQELHRRDYFLGDMIQEGNMALMAALQEWSPEGEPGAWLEEQIRRGLSRSIKEKEQQAFEDEVLVEKVQRLEKTVRELSEDGERKFSLNELAVILDMDVEEIRDVLRLTGDDQ